MSNGLMSMSTDDFTNVCGTMSVPMLTSFLEIGFNVLADTSMAWIYPYSLANLTLKAKKNVYSYTKIG